MQALGFKYLFLLLTLSVGRKANDDLRRKSDL